MADETVLATLFELGRERLEDPSRRPETAPWRPGTYGGWAAACATDVVRVEHAARSLEARAAAAAHRALPDSAIDEVTARTADLIGSLLSLAHEITRDAGDHPVGLHEIRDRALLSGQRLLEEACTESNGLLHCAEHVATVLANVIDFRQSAATPGSELVLGPLAEALGAALAGGAAAIITTPLIADPDEDPAG